MRFRRLYGNVWRAEVQIGEEWLVLRRVRPQVLEHLFRIEIVREEIVENGHPGDVNIILEIGLSLLGFASVQVEVAVGRSTACLDKGLIEPPGHRQLVGRMAKMPLAGGIGSIAVVLQQPGERHNAIAEHAFITWHTLLIGTLQPCSHRPETRQVIVRTGHQHGPGGRAIHLRVEVGKPDAFFGQGVQRRGIDLAAIRPEFGKADVVGHNDQEVGPIDLCQRNRWQNHDDGGNGSCQHVRGAPYLDGWNYRCVAAPIRRRHW